MPGVFRLRRGDTSWAVCWFSLKAAKRAHQGDSKRIGVESVVGLDITPTSSPVVVAVPVRVAVVAVYRPDTGRVCVAIIVRNHAGV